MTAAAVARATACPRCGYDLRGVVDAWRETCPLTGECTECGLDLQWSEILNPNLRRPSWSVEYARHWAWVPWRCITTFGILHRPWVFWRSLKMSHPPRWGRLAAMLVLVVLAGYALFSISASVHGFDKAVANRMRVRPPPDPWTEAMWAGLFPLRRGNLSPFTRQMNQWGPVLKVVPYVLLFHTMCALSFAALPQSRRKAKVRKAHIVRIAICGIVPGLTLVTLWGFSATFVPVFFPLALLYTPFCVGHAAVWWSVATSEYLRMRHPWGVGSAAVVIALLTLLLYAAMLIVFGSTSFLNGLLV